ncbi:MAG: histidine kinase [Acidobacteria bacterium]|nr:histidine kinase [Acidobacteriota bacterium]
MAEKRRRAAWQPEPGDPFPVTGIYLPWRAPRRGAASPRAVFLGAELGIAGGVGAASGTLISVLAGLLDIGRVEGPLVGVGLVSGLFAGVIAVVAGREVLPKLLSLSLGARMAMIVLTLAGAAFAATTVGFFIFPSYAVHAVRAVLVVGAMNGLLALVAGTLVFVYEDLHQRLTRTSEMLAAERLAQAQARERAARAELQALQARINPHFFFNALNTAAAFVMEDPARAEELLERFAGLFRYAFRRGGEESVPLGDELKFIGDYLEIEKARFGERVQCELEVDPAVNGERVPPLILQPLVENALQHGRDPDTGEGLISVRAWRDAREGVVIEIRDHGPGPGELPKELPRGHALENICARLAAGRRARLEFGAAPDGPGTRVRVVFPPLPAWRR